MPLDLSSVYEAKERLKGVITKTPLSRSQSLSELCGCEIYLKKENLQTTGAFKIRGAYNKIASLEPQKRECGVIAASAGNHAQGVALSAVMFGIKAVIVMPVSTPITKIDGVKSHGAEVILSGANYDEAYAFALKYAQKYSLTFVHPFEDELVMAGQGTLALELLECCEDLDAVVVPAGGGGLVSGVATVIKALSPSTEVIAVSAKGAPALKNSYDAKSAQDTLQVRTIADGIAVRDTSSVTLGYILKNVDHFVSVDDAEIASAMLYLLESQKLVVEGAGAVGVAALMHGKLEHLSGKKVAIVLSGGNVDVTLLSVIIEKGLLKSGRKMNLTVTLIDKPGSLMMLTEILRDLNANIVQISYDRTAISLDYGDANVTLSLETKGLEHQDEILSKLREHGYIR